MSLSKNYSESLQLPQTDFPMKARLREREPEIIKQWRDKRIYHKLREKRRGAPLFFLPDGPPYANGPIHIGHVLNKILKDIVIKYKSMKGFDAPFLPSWDCHGLPIELKALKKRAQQFEKSAKPLPQGAKPSKSPKPDNLDEKSLRALCREEALFWVKNQEQSFKRLGILADWESRILTMDPDYEAEELRLFARLLEKGLIYRGAKPVFWCFKLKTALAFSEAEYKERADPSIYVKFALDKESQNKLGLSKRVSAVIWTTTPWTLPANSAIALNPDLQYGLYEGESEFYILALARAEKFFQETGLGPLPLRKSFEGKEWAVSGRFPLRRRDSFHQNEKGLLCCHPFMKNRAHTPSVESARRSPLILSPHVNLEAGTGLVHIAPGHGPEDFLLGLRYGIDKLCPIDEGACFHHSEDLPEWLRGRFIFKANKIISEKLRESGCLLKEGTLSHSAPHNPRSGAPLIYRLTPQWFLRLDGLAHSPNETGIREKALSACEKDIHFVPQWGKARLKAMIKNAPDWCLSRQRVWGVPLPVFYCQKCQAAFPPNSHPSGWPSAIKKSVEIIRSLADKIETSKKGLEHWFSTKAGELLPKGLKCQTCQGGEFKKGKDILDVWFDSGAQSFILEKKLSKNIANKVSKTPAFPSGEAGGKTLKQDPGTTALAGEPSGKGSLSKTKGDGKAFMADLFLEGSDQHRGWFQTSLTTSLALRDRPPFKSLFTHGFINDKQGRKMSKSRGNVLAPESLIEKSGAEILRLWCAGEDLSSDVNAGEESFQRVREIYRRMRNSFRFVLGSLKGFQPSKDLQDFSSLSPADRYILTQLNRLVEKGGRDLENFAFHKFCQSLNRFFTVDLSSFHLDIIKDRLYTFPEKSPERLQAQTSLYHLIKTLLPFTAPVTSFLAEEAYSFVPGKRKESVFFEDFPAPRPEWRDSSVEALFNKMFPLREQLNRQLEDLRRRGEIGSPLQAFSIITLPEDFISPVMNQRERLEFFSVSKLLIKTGPNFEIHVEKALGKKCPRCWFVTEKPNPAGLCPKCEKNLSP